MKKFMALVCCIVSVVCASLLSACGLFDDDWLNSNDDAETNEKNFSQYYVDKCPISFTEKSVILSPNYTSLQLIFLNSSDKKIIAYEAIVISYNVYGEELYNGAYQKIAETPSSFGSGKTDLHYYSVSTKVYYVEVYIYYTLFDDQTDWGCRTDISTEKKLELGTKYKIERG